VDPLGCARSGLPRRAHRLTAKEDPLRAADRSSLSEVGHEVSVANSRGPETLRELAGETGAKAVTVEEAARDKNLVVVTIPEKNIPSLPSERFAGASDDVVVVDTGNYYPQHRDGRIAAIEDGTAESRWFEQHLAHPVDAGRLDESWRQQPGSPVYTTDLDAAGVREALAQAAPVRKPGVRVAASFSLIPRRHGEVISRSA
jgi:predicted dinucleotide-binding enzyme